MMREGVELEFVADLPPLSVYPPPGLEPSNTQLPIIREKVLALVAEGWVKEALFPLSCSSLLASWFRRGGLEDDHRSPQPQSLFKSIYTSKMSTALRVGAAILGPRWGATLDREIAYQTFQ